MANIPSYTADWPSAPNHSNSTEISHGLAVSSTKPILETAPARSEQFIRAPLRLSPVRNTAFFSFLADPEITKGSTKSIILSCRIVSHSFFSLSFINKCFKPHKMHVILGNVSQTEKQMQPMNSPTNASRAALPVGSKQLRQYVVFW